MSTNLSSLAYDDFNHDEEPTSLLEVNFSKRSNLVKAEKTIRKNYFSHFSTITDNVVEVGGTIIVSF